MATAAETENEAARILAALPEPVAGRLLRVRELVFAVASQHDVELEETTKWGQPSYLPTQPRVGSTLRLGQYDAAHWCMYVHCQTDLVSRMRALFPDWQYEGKRAVIFPTRRRLPERDLRTAIALVLTYHRLKRQERAGT